MTNRNVQRRIDSIQADDRGLEIDNPFYLRLPSGDTNTRPDPTDTSKLGAVPGQMRYNKQTGNIEIFLPEADAGGNATSLTAWTSIGLGTDPTVAQGDFLQRFGGLMYGDLRMAQLGGPDAAATVASAKGTGLRAGITTADFSRILNSDGTLADPAYSFDLDRNTGISRTGNDELSLIVGGTAQLVIDSSGVSLTGSFNIGDGTEPSPGIAFSSDLNTGLYRSAADTIGISIGGFEALELTPILGGGSRLNTQVTVRGDLVVQGTTTTVSAVNLNVTDNIILLNDGEAGPGVTLGFAGVEIDRGLAVDNTAWLYNEANNWWGPSGPSGSLVAGIGVTNTIGNISEINSRTADAAPSFGTDILFINVGSIQHRNEDGNVVSHGTLGNTSYSFEGDTDTGIYHPAQQQLGLAAGGDQFILLDNTVLAERHVLFPRQARGAKKASLAGVLIAQTADEGIPTWSFAGDSDTGIGSTNADELELVVGGKVALRLSANGNGQILLDAGSVSVPSLAFKSDTNTGIYSFAPNNIGFTSNGIIAATMNNGAFRVPDGLVTSPSLSFLSETGLGMRKSGAGALALTGSGIDIQIISAGSVITRVQHRAPAGNTGGPSYSFELDNTTGFFNSSSGIVKFSSNAVDSVTFAAGGVGIPDGSASGPSLFFNSDFNTGLFRPASDTMALATNGTERLRITSTGNIGIGSINPTTRLFVEATAPGTDVGLAVVNRDGLTSAGSSVTLFLGSSGPNTNNASKIVSEYTGSVGVNHRQDLVFHVTAGGSLPIERLRIDSNGGITVASGSRLFLDVAPTVDLEAATKKYVDDEIITAAGASAGDFVNVTGDTMSGALIINAAVDTKLTLQGSVSPQIRFESLTDDNYQIDITNGGFRINNATDSTTEMQFDGAGRIGIGTTSPATRVDIRNPENIESLLVLADSAGNQDAVARFQRSTTTLFTDPNTSMLVLENDNAPGDSVAMKFQGSGTHNVFGIIAGAVAGHTLRLNITGTPIDVMKWQLNGQVEFRDGTAGAPSITFDDDDNTGIYRIANDTLGFSTAGTERIRIDAAGNVGIGVTPTEGFELNTGLNGPFSRFKIEASDEAAGAAGGAKIAGYGGNAASIEVAAIDMTLTNGGTGTEAGALIFKTGINGTAAIGRMIINSDGQTTMLSGSRLFLDVDPISNLEAATKKYVDDEITASAVTAGTGFVNTSGDVMTGNLAMINSSIEIGNPGPLGATNLVPGADGSINAEEMFINNNRVATVDEATALAIVFGG